MIEILIAIFCVGALLFIVGRFVIASSAYIEPETMMMSQDGICKNCGDHIQRSSYGFFVHSNGMYSCYHCKTVAEL